MPGIDFLLESRDGLTESSSMSVSIVASLDGASPETTIETLKLIDAEIEHHEKALLNLFAARHELARHGRGAYRHCGLCVDAKRSLLRAICGSHTVNAEAIQERRDKSEAAAIEIAKDPLYAEFFAPERVV